MLPRSPLAYDVLSTSLGRHTQLVCQSTWAVVPHAEEFPVAPRNCEPTGFVGALDRISDTGAIAEDTSVEHERCRWAAALDSTTLARF